jgi:hypothetical protein
LGWEGADPLGIIDSWKEKTAGLIETISKLDPGNDQATEAAYQAHADKDEGEAAAKRPKAVNLGVATINAETKANDAWKAIEAAELALNKATLL